MACGSFAALFLTCYGPALFLDRQFGYGDTAHYYYPLHRRVQQEWAAGRWPLWEAEENAGMPLLGNPTAAVLYPGKLIFALLPYAWASRVYIIAHTGLAWMAMLVLMRSWGAGAVGSSMAAASYAFAGPVLFQSSNVIYLVGAAWLPLGVCAADRWVRLGRRRSILGLAVVLAMQALGGDPEVAYLLGWAAVGYACGLAWSRSRDGRPISRDRRAPIVWSAAGAGYIAVAVTMGMWFPRLRPAAPPGTVKPLPWMDWMPTVVACGWGLAIAGLLLRWSRGRGGLQMGRTCAGLVLAAGLAMAVASAQLLPVLEYMQQTQRASRDQPLDIYPFSLEPFRLIGLAWPDVLGFPFGESTAWGGSLRWPGNQPQPWLPSLYCGALTLLLGMGTLSFRGGPPWRVWMSAVMLVSLVGALGQYSSPIWATRALAGASTSPSFRGLAGRLGPLDPHGWTVLRPDGYLRDGDGGLYWWMSQILPGFRQFRFPFKLLVFTVLALSALAGIGWEDLARRPLRRTAIGLASFALLSAALLAIVLARRDAILAAFRAAAPDPLFGPLDAEGGFAAIVRALAQAGIVAGVGSCAVGLLRRRPAWAGVLVVVATSIDLAVANARYVVTIPQAVFDARPVFLDVIEADERAAPSSGPYRVHRSGAWTPMGWHATRSGERPAEIVAWRIDTAQPKFGIDRGVEYTLSPGAGEMADYVAFFRGFLCPNGDPDVARSLGIALYQPIAYSPRRSFDLWNTRYFVVPAYPANWANEQRAYASLGHRSERLYPPPEALRGQERYRRWVSDRDFQVLRNPQAFPRAWIVHDARAVPTPGGTSRVDRRRLLDEMTYCEDLWREAPLRVFDPRAVAWIDDVDLRELGPYLRGQPPGRDETVQVSYPDPRRVELEARLDAPGIVVLCDMHYPGWELTIDGRPAPIYRINLAMRGAAVDAGRHRLVYSYRPRSFRVGLMVSIAGLAALVLLAMKGKARPVVEEVAESGRPDGRG